MKKIYFLFIAALLNLAANGQRLLPVLDIDDSFPYSPVDDQVYCFGEWNGKLIVGGTFTSFNDAPYHNILAWDGQHAQEVGSPLPGSLGSDKVTAIKDFNGVLAIGCRIDLQRQVMLWNGTNWNVSISALTGDVLDMEVFNGSLYICGNFGASPILHTQGSDWPGIPDHGFTDVQDMIVFEDKLYVLGDMDSGPAIAAWSGTDWMDIALGSASINSLKHFATIGSDLMVCGSFDFGNVVKGVAHFVDYTIIPTDFWSPEEVNSLAVHQGKNYYYTGTELYVETEFIKKFQMGSTSPINPIYAPIFNYNQSLYVSGNAVKSIVWNSSYGFVSNGFYQIRDGHEMQNLHSNNVKALFSPTESFFFNKDEFSSGFLTPDTGNVGSIYCSSIWASGLSGSDTLVAEGRFHEEGDGWPFGPVGMETNYPYINKYYLTWKITRAQIENHIANYSNPNYEMPFDLNTWPGNGDMSNGEAHMLAPFHDSDGDSRYEPASGDYPLFPGDEVLFFILNDQRSFHEYSGFQPMKLELHVMAYAYENQPEPLNSTIFMHCNVFNRSENDYEQFRIGSWNDFDLGFSIDDFIGVDSLLNMAFVYNGDNNDESGSFPPGYGSNPPAQGCLFLNKEMGAHVYYSNSSNPLQGEPMTMEHYFYYMKGLEKNGDLMYSNDNITFGEFMYSDSPCGELGDNELGHGNVPSDRRTIASTQPETFAAGAYTCFDYAYIYHRDLSLDNFENACALSADAQVVKEFYETNNLNNCQLVTKVDEKSNEPATIEVYPNPGVDEFTIRFHTATRKNLQVTLFDSFGRKIQSKYYSNVGTTAIMNTNDIPTGVYLIQMEIEGKTKSVRWIKE